MNLELYKIFQAVAEKQSFTAAAKSLYITQPAVSQAMKRLEEELAVTLFSRTPKGILLTAEGKTLASYISSAMSLIEAGEEKLARMRTLEAGELKIGAGDTITKHFLLSRIKLFHKLYPKIIIKVTNRPSPDIIALVQSGQVDFGFVNCPIEAEGVELLDCMEIEDIFVAGSNFAELNGKRLSLEKLAQYPLLMLEPKSNSRDYVDTFFLSKGITLSPEIELGAYDLLLDFAKIGFGLACVIREFSQEAMDGSLFQIELTEPLPKRSIGICYLPSILLSTPAQAFISLVQNQTGTSTLPCPCHVESPESPCKAGFAPHLFPF